MLSQPKLSINPKKQEYYLLRDFNIKILNEEIVVPQFYSFDGASIPAVAWTITYTPFHPHVMVCALVHDFLYANHQVTKDVADKIFHQLLLDNGVGSKTAYLMYIAVKFGGGSAYKNNEKDIEYLKELYHQTLARTDDIEKYKFPKDIDYTK